MASILAIAEKILVDRIISNKVPVTGESKLKFCLITFSGLTAITGIGFLFYAAYLWLSVNFSVITTMAVMGCMFSLLSIAGCLILFAIIEYKKKKMKEMTNEIIDAAEQALEILEREITVPVNDNPKTSVLVSSLAGYLAGERLL